MRIIDYMIVVPNYNFNREVKACTLHLVQEKSVFSTGKHLITKDIHGFGTDFFIVKHNDYLRSVPVRNELAVIFIESNFRQNNVGDSIYQLIVGMNIRPMDSHAIISMIFPAILSLFPLPSGLLLKPSVDKQVKAKVFCIQLFVYTVSTCNHIHFVDDVFTKYTSISLAKFQ